MGQSKNNADVTERDRDNLFLAVALKTPSFPLLTTWEQTDRRLFVHCAGLIW